MGLPNPALQGGRLALEWVAAFAWNGWQASSGIGGKLHLEYATMVIDKVFAPYKG